MKLALELSRKDAIYISDNDEDMNRAIALSLVEAGEGSQDAATSIAAILNNASSAAGAAYPTLVVSDDEFDQMCSSDLSLKERLSKSSLDSEEDEDTSVRILSNQMPNEENANLPGPSNIPLIKRNQKVSGK